MEERKFTPEEAQRIVEMSLRLQSHWNENVSVAEIERTAAECGVEQRFVHQALRQLNAPDPESRPTRTVAVGKEHAFIAIFSATFAIVTWAFACYVSTTYQPIRLGDFAPFLMMTPIFGMISQARKKPWLAMVPVVVTFAMTIAALIFSAFVHRGQLRPPGQIIEDMAALVLCEAIAFLVGYGLARLVEALRPPAQRSYTN